MSSHLPLENFTIERFRGIKNLTLNNLGQVNVLVGKNDSGKTSVLEALELYSNPWSSLNWRMIAERRFIFDDFGDVITWLFPIKTPEIKQSKVSSIIAMQSEGSFAIRSLKIPEKKIENRSKKVIVHNLVVDIELTPKGKDPTTRRRFSLAIEEELRSSNPSFERTLQTIRKDNELTSTLSGDNPYLRTNFISPHTHRMQPDQTETLSQLIRSGKKSALIDLMQDVDQNINDIEILILQDSRRTPTIHFLYDKDQLVPLSAFGDGVRKLFYLALRVLTASTGILLIDEIESSIHTEVLVKSFSWIMKWCRSLEIQIFLTTHSLEALDALIAAAKDFQSSFTFYRLSPKENQVKTFRYDLDDIHTLRYGMGQEVRW